MTACGHARHVGTCPHCQRTQLARWRAQLQEATERLDVSPSPIRHRSAGSGAERRADALNLGIRLGTGCSS
jgi:hypothetical protein